MSFDDSLWVCREVDFGVVFDDIVGILYGVLYGSKGLISFNFFSIFFL